MSKLSEAKTLGGVGSILLVLAAIPSVGWLLAIVGAVLILIAIKYISDSVGDSSIFTNMLVAIVLAIAGLVVGVLVIAASVFRAIGIGLFSRPFTTGPPTVATGDIVGLILGAVTGLVIIWILLLISAIFVRRSYGSMATKLGVGIFGTTGLLYLIGAALSIILVGFVIIFIAQILNIVSFFSIRDEMPAMAPTPPNTPTAPPPVST